MRVGPHHPRGFGTLSQLFRGRRDVLVPNDVYTTASRRMRKGERLQGEVRNGQNQEALSSKVKNTRDNQRNPVCGHHV